MPDPEWNPKAVAGAIERWFRANARPLPWRPDPIDGPRDPYRALVSELMLQQTQVARVIEKYELFLERFPTAESLAAAPEPEVLAAWSGLGYYRRARLLHAAAKAVVDNHGGAFPIEPQAIRALPGVGPYTAGALASMVFGQREALVDGNVERVLLRLHASDAQPTDRATQKWSWARAAELVEASEQPGMLNEGLMELGATVCTPATPRCPDCPVRAQCRSFTQGRTAEIPTPKPRAKQKPWFIVAAVQRDRSGRVLIEDRPPTGLWAGMIQPPSLEGEHDPGLQQASELLGASLEPGETFEHVTTHRRVRFEVCRATGLDETGRRWATPDQISGMALSNAHRRVLLEIAPRL